MSALPADELSPPPAGARTFTASREVRFGDVDRLGRLRLDALATYLQDLAGDDTADAGLRGLGGWVVRRSVFEVLRRPQLGLRLAMTTWAAGAGSRWAERRISIRVEGVEGAEPTAERRAGQEVGGREARGQVAGDQGVGPREAGAVPAVGWGGQGSVVEGVSLWVYVDPATLRPAVLDSRFVDVYHRATGGRVVSSRLQHPPRPDAGTGTERRPWPLRATDIDPFGHVHNAVMWVALEEELTDHPQALPLRAEIEHRAPIPPDADVVIEVQRAAGGSSLWWREAGANLTYATARLRALPG